MVRIFVSSRRPCDSDALATSSYGTNLAQPLSAATLVSAAVSVVLPWSIWPIVPTFTCGFERSNFSFAIALRPRLNGVLRHRGAGTPRPSAHAFVQLPGGKSSTRHNLRLRQPTAASVHLRHRPRHWRPRWTNPSKHARPTRPANRSRERSERLAKVGADDRDRTGDLVLTKDVLCQLSYIGASTRRSRGSLRDLSPATPTRRLAARANDQASRMERETGIEPATNSLEGCDSTTELLPPSSLDSAGLQSQITCDPTTCNVPAGDLARPARAPVFSAPRLAAPTGDTRPGRRAPREGPEGPSRMVAREGFEPSKP